MEAEACAKRIKCDYSSSMTANIWSFDSTMDCVVRNSILCNASVRCEVGLVSFPDLPVVLVNQVDFSVQSKAIVVRQLYLTQCQL